MVIPSVALTMTLAVTLAMASAPVLVITLPMLRAPATSIVLALAPVTLVITPLAATWSSSTLPGGGERSCGQAGEKEVQFSHNGCNERLGKCSATAFVSKHSDSKPMNDSGRARGAG